MSAWWRLRDFARYEEIAAKVFSADGCEPPAGWRCKVLLSAKNGDGELNSALECVPMPLLVIDVAGSRGRNAIFEVEPGNHVSLLALLWRWNVAGRTRRLFSAEEI